MEDDDTVIALASDVILTALGLAGIGMLFVFVVLFGVEILTRIIGKAFGPKPQPLVPESPPTEEIKQGG